MNILGTQYDIVHNALEIYFSGCIGNPHCKGCFSPETWQFNQGQNYLEFYNEKIINELIIFDNMIDNIMLFGGEPLDQNMTELNNFLIELSKYNKKIWIFTHYSLEKALEILKDNIQYVDYIKCGSYIPELEVDNNIQYGIKLATSNQKIYKKQNKNFT